MVLTNYGDYIYTVEKRNVYRMSKAQQEKRMLKESALFCRLQ